MPRTRKILPDYWKVTPNGVYNKLDVNIHNYFWNGDYQTKAMSPYTNFIPLYYLFLSDYNISKRSLSYIVDRLVNNGKGSTIAVTKARERVIKELNSDFSMIYDSIIGKNNVNEAVSTIDDYLMWDTIVNLAGLSSRNVRSVRPSQINGNVMNDISHRLGRRVYAKTWEGIIFPYTFFQNDRNLEDQYKSLVVATVLPENYEYQKMRILLGMGIDMSKVIILINRDIESTTFRPTSVRKFYKDKILPTIMDSSADVWYVPHSFIDENCFVNTYQLTSTGMMNRKAEKEAYVKEFLKLLGGKVDHSGITYMGPLSDTTTGTGTYTVSNDNNNWTFTVNPLPNEGISYIIGEVPDIEVPDAVGSSDIPS